MHINTSHNWLLEYGTLHAALVFATCGKRFNILSLMRIAEASLFAGTARGLFRAFATGLLYSEFYWGFAGCDLSQMYFYWFN